MLRKFLLNEPQMKHLEQPQCDLFLQREDILVISLLVDFLQQICGEVVNISYVVLCGYAFLILAHLTVEGY